MAWITRTMTSLKMTAPWDEEDETEEKGGNQMNFTSSPFERMMKEKNPVPRLPPRTGPGAPPVVAAVTGGDRLCVLLPRNSLKAGAGGEVMDCPVN